MMTAMLFYEPGERDRDLLPHDPFKALVAPRPIGWVSTVSFQLVEEKPMIGGT